LRAARGTALGVLATLAAAATASTARAEPPDRPALPDERPRDKDELTENRSHFWERALRPTADAYESNVARAREMLRQQGPTAQLDAAAGLLDAAIATEPATAEAYWWLGEVHRRQGNWRNCAGTLGKLFELAPEFESPDPRDGASALDLALGNCYAQAGEFEAAIGHYKRILADGARRDPSVRWRLGNSYMAIGQLADAIDAFENAIAERPRSPFPYFAAAVAYDRDEQRAKANDRMAIALRRDPTLTSLSGDSERFAPAADALYFKGLAYAARQQPAHALVHLRRYLAVGDPAWQHRTRKHLRVLEAARFSSEELRIRGSANLDRDRARAAVLRRADALHECVAGLPRLLLEVRITAVTRPDSKGSGSTATVKRAPSKSPPVIVRLGSPSPGIRAPRSGIHVRAVERFDLPDAAAADAVLCVRERAESIKLPPPTGRPNSYATVEFFLTPRGQIRAGR